MQGTVRLFIQVEDYDPFGPDDHVADIYVTITLTPNSSFSARRAYNARDTNRNPGSVIELSFRVQCASNFYGSDCATYCVARDDREGHFDCGPDGENLCLSGWSDPSRNCTICKLYRVLSSSTLAQLPLDDQFISALRTVDGPCREHSPNRSHFTACPAMTML